MPVEMLVSFLGSVTVFICADSKTCLPSVVRLSGRFIFVRPEQEKAKSPISVIVSGRVTAPKFLC